MTTTTTLMMKITATGMVLKVFKALVDKALEASGVAVAAQEPCLVSVRLFRWASCFAAYICKRFHLTPNRHIMKSILLAFS